MTKPTIVTAFFDINREKNGDGRKISEYLQWIKSTLLLNCNLYVVTEKKFTNFIRENRPETYPLVLIEDTLDNALYSKYKEKMKTIMESSTYKCKIQYPKRVECILPEYNIIQYSKFGWLQRAIEENPFNSDYFFWMDIGISRFFNDMKLNVLYPSNQDVLCKSQNKFIIQQRHDLQEYKIDENFIWKADNLFKGGMFGGYKDIVVDVGKQIEQIFIKEFLENNNVNNEQIAFTLLWKKHPELFFLIPDINRHPCILLHLLR